MDLESYREACLRLKGVTEGFPFGEGALIFKVLDKMFATLSMEPPFRTNLKCDPERAIELRASNPAIIPGYHMNKKHWNTIDMQDLMDDALLLELLQHSYDLVVKGMKKSDREKLMGK